MNPTTDNGYAKAAYDIIQSAMGGFGMRAIVQSVVFPLEVIKIRQQCLTHPEWAIKVARTLYQEEGLQAFFQGFKEKITGNCMKQLWVWPMITEIPKFLEGYNVNRYLQQLITGLSIATFDTVVLTPLERSKNRSANAGHSSNSIVGAYKEGWGGFTSHWAKASSNWSMFLVLQKYLSDRKSTPEKKPTWGQLTIIGVQIAIIVSVVGAPFDVVNTLKLAKDESPTVLFSNKKFRKLYRGAPINFLNLAIQAVASVMLIHKPWLNPAAGKA